MLDDLLTLVVDSSSYELSSRSTSLNSNNCSSQESNKSFKTKVGSPKKVYYPSLLDAFSATSSKSKMDRQMKARKAQKEYLDLVLKEGDIHYYKQQNFNPNYKRTNKDGVLTPQGAFDVDPVQFMEDYMEKDEFEYLGVEFVSPKKGVKQDYYHKILVKGKVLYDIVMDYVKTDELYIPMKGQVLGYTKFFSDFVCGNRKHMKGLAKEERNKMSIARKNTLEGIVALEKQELVTLEERFKVDMSVLVEKRKEMMSSLRSTYENIEDAERFNSFKLLFETKESDLEKKFLLKKSSIVSKYDNIKSLREKVELNRVAISVKRNLKRRKDRAVKKRARLDSDNNLTEEGVNSHTTCEKDGNSSYSDSEDDSDLSESEEKDVVSVGQNTNL